MDGVDYDVDDMGRLQPWHLEMWLPTYNTYAMLCKVEEHMVKGRQAKNFNTLKLFILAGTVLYFEFLKEKLAKASKFCFRDLLWLGPKFGLSLYF